MAKFDVSDRMDADLAQLFVAGEGKGELIELLYATAAVSLQSLRDIRAANPSLSTTGSAIGLAQAATSTSAEPTATTK